MLEKSLARIESELDVILEARLIVALDYLKAAMRPGRLQDDNFTEARRCAMLAFRQVQKPEQRVKATKIAIVAVYCMTMNRCDSEMEAL